MFVRPAELADLDRIGEIYAAARAYMRAHGNDVQWNGGDYPGREKLSDDIAKGQLFVVCDASACGPCDGAEYAGEAGRADERIYGAFAFIIGEDPTYGCIEGGAWNSDGPYATVHRMGSSGEVKGVSECAFEWACGECRRLGLNLRCDTHELNLTMQGVMKKQGFDYCGIIYEPDDTPRLAYQKLIAG